MDYEIKQPDGVVADVKPALTETKIIPRIFQTEADEERIQSLLKKVIASKISLQDEIEEPELLIGMNEAPVLYRGSMCFVCGQAGSRKTTGITLLCADMIAPGKIADSPFTIPKPLKVLFIDTEQFHFDTAKIVRRIDRLVGFEPTTEMLNVYPLLQLEVKDIPVIVERLIDLHRPDLVVIDNIGHMGTGLIMDLDKAEELHRNLRRLAVEYDCGLIGVIHMNEGAKSARPRGHAGAEAVREADLVLMFEDIPGAEHSEVKAIKSRQKKPGKWGVAIDEEGRPYYCEVITEESQPKTKGRKPKDPALLDKYVKRIPRKGITGNELGRLIDELDGKKVTPKSRPSKTADNRKAEMETTGLIRKVNNLWYATEWAPSDDEELPF